MKTKKQQLALAVCGLLGIALVGPSSAAVYTLSGTMDPLQAGTNGGFGGGTGSGTGTISGSYDDVTNEISYIVTWSNLTSPVTVAHFHVGAPGVSGGAELGFSETAPSISIGTATLTETQEADLLAGNWYANIHTTSFTGGEIRGQVIVPEPQSVALVGAGALLLLRRRRRA